MCTFEDWLRFYNNLDVAPGLEALEKMRNFYTEKGIDILKDAVSIPGVSLHYLLRGAVERGAELYALCKEAYEMLKEAVVGGAEPGFHKVPRSWCHGDKVTSNIRTASLQKYPWLRCQRPLSFDHAQRNAVRKGEGRALRRRVQSGGGTCAHSQAQNRKLVRIR